ncbi:MULTISPECIES: hypothetical protein [Niastella]|uniref:Uncharacterized protein n=1 Tax=Niastella soli TaxID=2821487 RepID=A0ABS3YZP3_9BACT|nr:hypothetical protein [Niastella soli]MBO9203390.1 hypothetical protein [Niastella soli]
MKFYILLMVSGIFNFADPVLQKSKSEVVIYATDLLDRRNIPMNKELLKSSYEFCTRLSGEEYVNEFLKMTGKYDSTTACKKCGLPFDTRIYIQVYEKGKLGMEMEICAGGDCIKILNKPYCMTKETLNFILSCFPARNREKYSTLNN